MIAGRDWGRGSNSEYNVPGIIVHSYEIGSGQAPAALSGLGEPGVSQGGSPNRSAWRAGACSDRVSDCYFKSWEAMWIGRGGYQGAEGCWGWRMARRRQVVFSVLEQLQVTPCPLQVLDRAGKSKGGQSKTTQNLCKTKWGAAFRPTLPVVFR